MLDINLSELIQVVDGSKVKSRRSYILKNDMTGKDRGQGHRNGGDDVCLVQIK